MIERVKLKNEPKPLFNLQGKGKRIARYRNTKERKVRTTEELIFHP